MGGADPSGGGGDHSGGIHMTDSGRTGAYGVLMAVVVWMGGAGRTSGGARARTAMMRFRGALRTRCTSVTHRRHRPRCAALWIGFGLMFIPTLYFIK